MTFHSLCVVVHFRTKSNKINLFVLSTFIAQLAAGNFNHTHTGTVVGETWEHLTFFLLQTHYIFSQYFPLSAGSSSHKITTPPNSIVSENLSDEVREIVTLTRERERARLIAL